MDRTYSTFDITRALGIPRERLRDWMSKGFIVPSVPAAGQGTRAEFTYADVLIVALFRQLIEKGFQRETASNLIGSLKIKFEMTMLIREKRSSWAAVFRRSSFLGKEHTEAFFIEEPGDNVIIDLLTGYTLVQRDYEKYKIRLLERHIQEDAENEGKEYFPREDYEITELEYWDDILIVNLKKLKREVDMALRKLD